MSSESECTIETDSNASESSCDTVSLDFASIASTVPEYVYRDGRRYHASAGNRYLFPNDEREQDRLDFVHHLFRLTLDDELCYARLDNPQRILDIGTGTGIWAIEMAEEYPNAEVIGTDLDPIQPRWAPPNVQFIVDDALQEWTFPESSFDFIHLRCLGGSIPDWPSFLEKCYRHLRPGGQLEITEGRTQICCDDGTYPEDSLTKFWDTEFQRICNQSGYDFDIFPKVGGWLAYAGFSEIQTTEKVMPFSPWPKDRELKHWGKLFLAQFLHNGLDTYTIGLFTRAGGWNYPDLKKLLTGVAQEVARNKMHLYTHFSFAAARKPLQPL